MRWLARGIDMLGAVAIRKGSGLRIFRSSFIQISWVDGPTVTQPHGAKGARAAAGNARGGFFGAGVREGT